MADFGWRRPARRIAGTVNPSAPKGKAAAWPPHSKRGFTLIEALVSVVLLAIGIVAATTTLSQMTRSEGLMRDGEKMRRLADQKLQELVATGDYAYVTSGDFSEQGEERYSFTATLEPTGVENLHVVVVQVTSEGSSDEQGYEASQLLFIPPTQTDGAQ